MKRIVLIVFALSLLVGTGCCKQSEQALLYTRLFSHTIQFSMCIKLHIV